MKRLWQISMPAAIVFFIATAGLPAYGQTSAGTVLTSEQAKAIGDRYLEARHTRNLALLDDVYAPDVVVHYCDLPENLVGLDALKAYYTRNQTALPDLKMSLEKTLLSGDYIIWFWTVTGTNTGPLGDLPPSGKSVRFSGVAVDRVSDGKIVEEWAYFNPLDLFAALGFTLTPPSPTK